MQKFETNGNCGKSNKVEKQYCLLSLSRKLIFIILFLSDEEIQVERMEIVIFKTSAQ